MKVEKFYQDFGIDHLSDGHKHCRPGWVNTPCPFCTGNPGYHLGFEAAQNYFYCWRCGHHSAIEVVAALAHVTKGQAFHIVKQYHGQTKIKSKRYKEKELFSFPSNTTDLLDRHKTYIENRGFDPEEIEKLFGVKSTGIISNLDKISYKHRILMPVFWKNDIVSFQARDVTNKHTAKYLACPLHRETIAHQSIVYSCPLLLKRKGLIVEGPTDVWRFKESTVATFGIEFTNGQVRAISKLFEEVIIAFDPEKQATKQAKKLRAELKFRGVKCRIESLPSDPGDMDQKEADYFVKHNLK